MKKRTSFILTLFLTVIVHSSFSQEIDSISYYKSIHYRGSAKIEINEQLHNCQFNFVNVIDSFLYAQINVAGIEICRVLATPVQILIINKLERNYYEGDYLGLLILTGIDFDFYTLQDVFNGVPGLLPYGISLSYSGELSVDGYSFFKVLTCEHEKFSMKLEIKKVTFDDAPVVSATIPKNFTVIDFFKKE
jgi:hypothetical protein